MRNENENNANGATGFPGSEILRSLTKSGYEINVKAVMT
jgi:hypothetical protein